MEILGLVKRYGDTTAVDGLDLRLESGHTLALLGPNGAGKTTTVEACEGFRSPDAGTVRVLGIDPYSGPRAHANLTARIGVMLQEGGIYPAGRPREVLRLQAALYANPLDPDALLDLLGIAHVANRPFRRLSGGEQQRLSLALALVGRPELVFLDEPTAGLDPQARHTVWDILRDLRAAGVSILLTTHLLDEAEELADHVVIIDRGSVLAAGSPQELTAVSGTAGPGGAGSDERCGRGAVPRTVRSADRRPADSTAGGLHCERGTIRSLPDHGSGGPTGTGDDHVLVRLAGRDAPEPQRGPPKPGGRVPRPHRTTGAPMTASAPPFSPAPGAAPRPRMLSAVASHEFRQTLRNGEQLLLTLVIPIVLLVLFATVDVADLPGDSRIDYLVPSILALAIMSTAFTGQAIGTAFERRYGVLKRLGATPLPRWVLLSGKGSATAAVLLVQAAAIVAVGAALGWSPQLGASDLPAILALVVLGAAAFSGLAFLMAGTLRAEAVLGGANLVYLLFLVTGGVIFPLSAFPDSVATVLEYLPLTALAEGLRVATTGAGAVPGQVWLVLVAWAVAGLAAAAAAFRWE